MQNIDVLRILIDEGIVAANSQTSQGEIRESDRQKEDAFEQSLNHYFINEGIIEKIS